MKDSEGTEMTEAPDLSRMLGLFGRLPATPSVVFRGLTGPTEPPPGINITTALHSASRSPRVATENFSTRTLLALRSRTGRDLGPFSAQPDESEVLILPATPWRLLGILDGPEGDFRVIILEEVALEGQKQSAPKEWGRKIDKAVAEMGKTIVRERLGAPVTVHVPGKFCGPWEHRSYE